MRLLREAAKGAPFSQARHEMLQTPLGHNGLSRSLRRHCFGRSAAHAPLIRRISGASDSWEIGLPTDQFGAMLNLHGAPDRDLMSPPCRKCTAFEGKTSHQMVFGFRVGLTNQLRTEDAKPSKEDDFRETMRYGLSVTATKLDTRPAPHRPPRCRGAFHFSPSSDAGHP
jgi:hypothetical protein